MGMNFSPMYQPVSTKTIKADGDLNVSPYDVIAYDGKFDTVEADEFVGGVGNFSSVYASNVSWTTIPLYKVVLSSNTILPIIALGSGTNISANDSTSIQTADLSANTETELLLYIPELKGCIGDIDQTALEFVLYKYGSMTVSVRNSSIDISLSNGFTTLSYSDFKSIVNEQTYISTGAGSNTRFGFGIKNITSSSSTYYFTHI